MTHFLQRVHLQMERMMWCSRHLPVRSVSGASSSWTYHRCLHQAGQKQNMKTACMSPVSLRLRKAYKVNFVQTRAFWLSQTCASKWMSKHESDGVDKQHVMMYVNSNIRYITGCYFAMAVSSFVGTALAMHKLLYMSDADKYDLFELEGQIPQVLFATCGMLLLAAVAYTMLSRMLPRIYYDPSTDTFTGVAYNWMLQANKFHFKREHVSKRDVSKYIMGELFGNIYIKDRPYLVQPLDFKSNVYYNKLLGRIKFDEFEGD